MSTSTQKLLANINNYYLTPSLIQQDILDVLEDTLNGDMLVDATNPFSFLMEATATSVAAAISKTESVARRLYPQLAVTMNDLYYHLSDRHYADIYATPATTSIEILIPYDLLFLKAVKLNPDSDTKTITIPRNTMITVNNYSLSICYPIIIELAISGNILVSYDTTIISPSLLITNSLLTKQITTYQDKKYLQINVLAVQLASYSSIYTLTPLSSFSYNLPFTDNFCYLRAFINLNNNTWTEIQTSYNNKIYDINKPTIIVEVLEHSVNVILPDIYQSLNIAGNSIRIDLYTCKGEINYNLAQLSINDFSYNFLDYDNYNSNASINAINTINDVLIYSNDFILGGKASKTFNEIKNKIIYFEDVGKPPVRFSDIDLYLNNYGYTLEKIKDNLTDRIYIACKDLPTKTINGLTATPLMTNIPVTITFAGNNSNHYNLADYSDSLIINLTNKIIITTNALFKVNSNNDIDILTNTERTNILNLYNNLGLHNNLITELNNNRYFYSPFSYLLDFTENTLKTIAINFDDTIITQKNFINSNKLINYNINTLTATISLVGNNYRLVIVSSIANTLTEITLQLHYTDINTNLSYYINSTATTNNGISGSKATFVFNIGNSFDILNFNQMRVKNFFDKNGVVNNNLIIDIQSTFSLFYIVQGDNTNFATPFDNLYITHDLTLPVISATYETIGIQFCKVLNEIYCPNNEKISTPIYDTYTAIEYATYQKTVYKAGPYGYEYVINPDNTVTFTVLHNVGDPMLDIHNNPIILHNIGDFKTVNDELVALNNTLYTQRTISILGIDAGYMFSTYHETVEYKNIIPTLITNYIDNEIKPLAILLNERTELYYKPKGDYQLIDVFLDNNSKVSVSNRLDISITFYLSSFDINNKDFKQNVEKTTRILISKFIKNTILSKSDFTAQLQDLLGNSILGFNINSLLPNNYSILSIIDKTKTFYINEKMVLLPDNSINIQDTIKFVFKQLE